MSTVAASRYVSCEPRDYEWCSGPSDIHMCQPRDPLRRCFGEKALPRDVWPVRLLEIAFLKPGIDRYLYPIDRDAYMLIPRRGLMIKFRSSTCIDWTLGVVVEFRFGNRDVPYSGEVVVDLLDGISQGAARYVKSRAYSAG